MCVLFLKCFSFNETRQAGFHTHAPTVTSLFRGTREDEQQRCCIQGLCFKAFDLQATAGLAPSTRLWWRSALALLSCILRHPFLSAAGGLCCIWQWRAGRCCIQCNWMMWHRFSGSRCQQSFFGPHCSSPSSKQQIKTGAEMSDQNQQRESKHSPPARIFYYYYFLFMMTTLTIHTFLFK